MLTDVAIRPWMPEDAGQLAAICNNRKIWLNTRDRFPHPYTVANAVEWIIHSATHKPTENLAILYKTQVVGGIGVISKEDVYRRSIEIGYLLGEQFWGHGIVTSAVSLLIDYIKANFNVFRVFAEVFAHNKASMRVLEKNGFHLESTREKAVIKDNVILDDCVWVRFI